MAPESHSGYPPSVTTLTQNRRAYSITNWLRTKATRVKIGTGRGLGIVGLALALTACGSHSTASTTGPATTTTAPATTTTAVPPHLTARTPQARRTLALYGALLKTPSASSLPPALVGSQTKAAPLSAGSKKHHASGAVETTNGSALAGFLVFETRGEALSDLKAYPPNRGPNKLVSTDPKNIPKPAYVLRALGNGYTVRYVVFVDGPVVVTTWAYGQNGKTKETQLLKLVEQTATWAASRVDAAMLKAQSVK